MSRNDHNTLSEEELVAALQQRSDHAVGVLYDRYGGALYSVIHRIVQSDTVAEDVVQETFVKIWTSFGSYDASKGRLFTWIVKVARNLAIDKIKSKEFRNVQKNQDIDSVVALVDEQSHTGDRTDGIGLTAIVHSLKPEQEQLVDLIYYQGYTQAEAAEKLGIPLGTVKTRLRAAISVIRKFFD